MAPIDRQRAGDEVLLASLGAGMTYRAAAVTAKVSERTVRRPMADPQFRSLVIERRRLEVEQVRGALLRAASGAVETLVELAESAGSETVRLGAARALLEAAAASRPP